MSQFLKHAVDLAKMVEGQTGVNPPVGAIVVKEGRIVGLGAHLQRGDKHAEVQALEMAQEKAKDATIYVSLEPCSHYGTTPPCVEKIIEYGISKVVYAVKDTTLMSDSDDILNEAGIEVEFSYNEEAAQLCNDFFKAKKNGKPEVTVKVSCSLDGKQANDNGQSQWITNRSVKQDVFNLRHKHDAVLTGRETLIADDPQYTTRIENGKNPVKVILTKTGDIDFDLKIFSDMTTPILIYTENKALTSTLPQVKIIYMENSNIANILEDLYLRGVGKLLVEAGPTITSTFIETKEFNKLIIYYAPKVIGGSGKYQFYSTDNVFELSEVQNFEIVNSRMLENNLKLELRKK
ncbi:bifunctional diaminohydroxyphosphoribosylaminopyrimidine deaminase/5-amino-6-(5-phosphoribosylamino)uracil reductase RibD [Staphylococcus sp. 18_1_E_LY]|uniref:Riboflavin biosynthesis protein RibD n=1 Tax=Staphylococcus lloydii TaxID=2781774 RepID=A0A7T1B1Q9_9STAP|nr:bifunctional diaminohydroxyphosphoribosylaminopyrimidine deaminase/5-amino-6-(5-phosphoribosylamino)uracil reductase RibD [Staphylococcus lloydii]MBF7018387.1 bifunctional diaminohydroxyphosphoribosylaminopyrimidine deaminase/5-amino-6-(5-phosphoribosylamino)uracil reductase RibD [Staphylococcus lloydii]MBF7026115.1 bifunctional diaminohydroxyphosphoribosylaminopyrimidine deaminase/5-amino-6-(5-phosphoribosylamino)uracil reductase RibD [Staphylococcus lloydii]QPM76137.1 bifunctional diaminohy